MRLSGQNMSEKMRPTIPTTTRTTPTEWDVESGDGRIDGLDEDRSRRHQDEADSETHIWFLRSVVMWAENLDTR